MLKRLDKYILKSFIGPFIVTFFIALVILLIQFLWKYIEDLVGKGLGTFVIAKLLFYASANMIPLALPLATLLSSIMVYGNLGERFELAALKSAGISMFRFMRSTIIAGIFIAFGAFMFSNYVLPKASLKFWTTLIDITKQKPALNIKPDQFYNEIDNYSILIGSKQEDNIHISDITIYEEGDNKHNTNVLIAAKGEMLPSSDKKNLILKLEEGKQYEELKPEVRNKQQYEHMRMEFGTWEKVLDLSGFEMQQSSEELYKDHYRMMNVGQLEVAIDSLVVQSGNKSETLSKVLDQYFTFNRDTAFATRIESMQNLKTSDTSFIESVSPEEQKVVIKRALASVRNISNYTQQIEDSMRFTNEKIADHKIEWHRKFTLSVICLVFIFVGAPLGAIIRKGGFGLPVIFSIFIFIIYYVISITGEKMAEQAVISPFTGMWMAIFIIFPFSLYLTLKAKNDSPLFSLESYSNFFYKAKQRLFKK